MRERGKIIVVAFSTVLTLVLLIGALLGQVRDSQEPSSPGYLRSSSFGKPITTAGGVFGSGGPRALQLGLRFRF